MRRYYIIDWDRGLHLVKAGSIIEAKDVYSDKHIVQADVIIETTECPKCKKCPKPDVPEWMIYIPHPMLYFCHHAIDQEQPAPANENSFFTHQSKFI